MSKRYRYHERLEARDRSHTYRRHQRGDLARFNLYVAASALKKSEHHKKCVHKPTTFRGKSIAYPAIVLEEKASQKFMRYVSSMR